MTAPQHAMTELDWFETASRGFREIVAQIGTDQLSQHGLGEWDVRALLGHASRAFVTIESYLMDDASGDVAVEDAAAYYRLAAASAGLAADVAERGRAAGEALGDDPCAAVVEIVDRVTSLVGSTPDDARVRTPAGEMRLSDYLGTRAFEVTVHGIDLALATGQPIPAALSDAAAPAIDLCGRIADPPARVALLMTLTGRQPLASEFSVV